MVSKRARGYDEEGVPPQRRLRSNIADLCLNNDISGARARSVFEDAAVAGAVGVSDLARSGAGGAQPGNAHRDLLRRLMRRSGWPKPYFAKIGVYNLKDQKPAEAMIPLWLPHELLRSLARRGSVDKLADRSGLCEDSKVHMERVSQELGSEQLAGVGLWGDGVPFNWDRSQTVVMVSLSLPGVGGGFASLRLPLMAMNKKFMLKHQTLDQVFAVLVWSFECLAVGEMPRSRHDGSPFLPSDSERRRQAGTAIGIRGAIAQVAGDWMFYKEAFRFPQHNEQDGCCWRCGVTPATLRQVGLDAEWRSQRLSHWNLLARMLQKGKGVSPLFSCPGVRSNCFLLDWMHIMDLGRWGNHSLRFESTTFGMGGV